MTIRKAITLLAAAAATTNAISISSQQTDYVEPAHDFMAEQLVEAVLKTYEDDAKYVDLSLSDEEIQGKIMGILKVWHYEAGERQLMLKKFVIDYYNGEDFDLENYWTALVVLSHWIQGYFRHEAFVQHNKFGIQQNINSLIECRRTGGAECEMSNVDPPAPSGHIFDWIHNDFYSKLSSETLAAGESYFETIVDDLTRMVCIDSSAELLSDLMCHKTEALCEPSAITDQVRNMCM